MRLRFVATLLLAAATGASAQDLDVKDRELLDELLRSTLFDPPADAERVVIKAPLRSVWGSVEEVERHAWLVPAQGDRPARVFSADGRPLPTPPDVSTLVRVDMVALVREQLRPRNEAEERDERFRAMDRAAGRGAQHDPDLALAAWLHRRGEDALASVLMAHVRKALGQSGEEPSPTVAEVLRGELAWEAFAGMVHAYMVRADDEALAHGEHLLSRYAEAAKGYGQAQTIVDELRRRRTKGTAGKVPASKPPEGFASKPPAEQVAWLVDALEEVDARQFSQPGGVDLSSDWRVQALIELGEVAVPALIDAVEQDMRLTRSVHFWRDFARSRTVLSVREAALVSVMSILRVQVFEPSSTGDSFTAADPARAKDAARRLREYWEKNKGLRIEQRMLRTLTAEDSGQEQRREAAQNLAELTGTRRIGTTVWGTRSEPGTQKTANPALALEDPTAAEAILAAMDRDLRQGDPRWRDDERMALYSRRQVETHYIECLITLGDRRIAPALRKRAEEATEMRMRRQWALACLALGDPAPMERFLADLAAGKLTLPPVVDPGQGGHLSEEPGAVELRQCIETIVRLGTPEANRALWAATANWAPFRETYALLLSRAGGGGWGSEGLFSHPSCLAVLLPELDRTEATGTTIRVEGDQLIEESSNGSMSRGGFDPAAFGGVKLARKVAERRCDRAAAQLSSALLGLPSFHVLMEDRDARVAQIWTLAARYAPVARRATPTELQLLGRSENPWHAVFIPALVPLGRAATEDDVAAGRAVFHLDGKGRPADLKLPATCKLVVEGGQTPALVVQAEETATGERRYGVIAVDRIEEVGVERVVDLQALPDPEAQRAAAKKLLDRAVANDVEGVRAMLGPDALAEVEQMGGLGDFVDQVRTALGRAPEERIVEALAPGFRAGEDGQWRLERFR